MNLTTAVKTCFAKYITFSGRAARAEYWYFFLFVLIVGVVATGADQVLFGGVSDLSQAADTAPVSALQSLVSLVVFLPHLAVAWRRMHDTGRSGIYVLLPTILAVSAALVLFFGIEIADHFSGGTLDILFTRVTLLIVVPTVLVLLISPLLVLWWLTRPSQPGSNSYGPNPYEVTP